GFVVEQVGRDPASDPWPANVFDRGGVLVAIRLECLLDEVRGGGVAVGESNREPVEHEVVGAWCGSRPRRTPRGLGCAPERFLADEARRKKRRQVCLARDCRFDSFEPGGGLEQQRRGISASTEVE